jgi:hypothetical protein
MSCAYRLSVRGQRVNGKPETECHARCHNARGLITFLICLATIGLAFTIQ